MFRIVILSVLLSFFLLFVALVLLILSMMGVVPIPVHVMGTVVGVLLIMLISVPIVGYIALAFFLKKIASGLKEVASDFAAAKSDGASVAVPRSKLSTQIHLVPAENAAIKDGARFDAVAAEFKALGFVDVGMYTVKETPGLFIRAFAIPEEPLWGTVIEHPKVGINSEVFSHFVEGGGWTAGNSEFLAKVNFSPLPNRPVDRLPGVDIKGLFDAWLKVKGRYDFKPIHIPDFQVIYETVYRETMEQRLAQGLASRAEVSRIAEAGGKNLNEEQLAVASDRIEEMAKERFETALRERYKDVCGLSEDEWNTIADRLVIIHEKMTVHEALEKLGTPIAGNPSLATGDPLAAFRTSNAMLKQTDQFTKIADLSSPVNADVYVRPERV